MTYRTFDELNDKLTAEQQTRINAIKRELIAAERGHELASLRNLSQQEVADAMGVTQGRSTGRF